MLKSALFMAAAIAAASSPLSAQNLPGKGFSILDQQKLRQVFGTEVSTETDSETIYEAVDRTTPFDYSQKAWNEARDAAESGALNRKEIVEVAQVETSSVAPEALPPSVELPSYGTSLSVTGRKLIGFNYNSKQYLNDQTTTSRPSSFSMFDLKQELQVRMQGKIGPKITVNVDYDDTKPDKQDISIVYQGDPQDVVQSASFGDIDLSLPATEFVSYNKQLFGIRLDIRYKHARAIFIGSRTKGTTKTKQFVGNTLFQAKDINDIQYNRRQYYDLTFGSSTLRLPIKQGSERIYLDNQTFQAANNIDIFDMTVDDLGINTSTYTGRFKLLSPGVDYNIDYIRGILTFRYALNPQDVIAANFQNAFGTQLAYNSSQDPSTTNGTGRLKLIKTKNDLYIVEKSSTSELGWKREIKTYYSVGQTQLVRDDGKGNFALKVMDLNHNEVGPSLNPVQKYPDTVEVDFEQGTFKLQKPFGSAADPNEPDPDVYAPSPIAKRLFRVEYYSRIRTFLLEPNIVVQSEVVLIDNARLTRNLDYYIDYDTGFITFYNEDRIKSSSKIDVTYDVSPFGGLGTSSLLGTRLSYEMGSHVAMGATLLYESASKAKTAPSIRDLAQSVLVYESDLQFKDLRILPRLKSKIELEAAQSKNNPNLNGFAIIDNMEGVKQQDAASVDANDWRISSNPPGSLGPADPKAVAWRNEDVKTLEINPAAQADANDKQRVLSVDYDLSVSSEVSIVYPFDDAGLDFSQKNMFEMIIYGDGSAAAPGPKLDVHFGQVNEDSDGNGGMTLHCANGTTLTGAPKTEDLNCDGQLENSEDIGWQYSPLNLASIRYGAGNGRIDTQDLNHNSRMDPEDFSGGDYGYVNNTSFQDVTANSQKTQVDFTGWHTFQTPMVIASTETYRWSAIRQVRLSLKYVPGGKTQGTIKIARLSVVGNTWEVNKSSSPLGSLSVAGINNADNPNYQPIFSAGGEASQVYDDLYGSVDDQKEQNNTKNVTEQALALIYNSTGTTVFTQKKFSQSIDISQHGQFRFLVNNPPGNEISTSTIFYIRVGNDTNYQEASFPINFTGWRLYVLEQVDLNGDNVSDVWVNGGNYTVNLSSAGLPNFQQVSVITAGLRFADSANHSGQIWLDEVHVGKPRTLVGNARKAQIDFDWENWAEFGVKYKFMDKNFQTPVTVSTKQDNETDTAYLKVKRLSWFPVNATYTRQIVNTPNALSSGNNNLVNLLQQGVVKTHTGSLQGTFNKPSLPQVTLGYSFKDTRYDLLTRHDDQRTYNTGLTYTVPLESSFVPKTIEGSYSLSRNKLSYASPTVLKTSGYYNADEITSDFGVKLGFIPWTGSALNPSYSLRQVKESRKDYTGAAPLSLSYAKAMQESTGFTSNFRFVSWFNPSVNYNVTVIENNNLTVSTATLGTKSQVYNIGEAKTVNRTANGTISWALNVIELLPRSRLLRSMVISSNYQLQDGDSWQYVEKDLNTKSALWIRTPLRSKSEFSQRTNLTLRDSVNSTQRWQPLEAYSFSERLSPLKTITMSNNYSKSIQRSEVTGTRTRTVSTTIPDVLTTISQLEKLLGTGRFLTAITTNLKYTHRTNETVSVSLDTENSYGTDLRFIVCNRVDSAISFNIKTSDKTDLRINKITQKTLHRDGSAQGSFDIKKFRFTPKVDYVYDRTLQTGGVLTQETTQITPSLLIRADMNLPKGLAIPFTNKTLAFTNRVVWTTTTSYAMKRSAVTVLDNSNLLNAATNADYEISKNLRLALNASLQRLWHLYLPQEDYIGYQAGTTLTLQF